jgi:hypothetical protein
MVGAPFDIGIRLNGFSRELVGWFWYREPFGWFLASNRLDGYRYGIL